jgi:hypothetical protein
MNSGILIAIISAAGGIIAAALTFYFTKRHQLKVEWRREKIAHYKALLASLSDLAVDGIDKRKALEDFSRAVNTIILVAPQAVVKSLMDFHDEIKYTNPNPSKEKHDRLLIELVLAIRKDMNLSDNDKTFDFHLIGTAPK